MKYQIQINRIIYLLFILFLSFSAVDAQRAPVDFQEDYKKSAKKIRTKYERYAFKLKPSKAGHMGLRLWRNYKDDKYKYLLLQGINHTASSLDKLMANGLDAESLKAYAQKSNAKYKSATEKKKRRKGTLEDFPQYRLMGAKVLRHVARLDELGLRHEHHDQFMSLLKSYDFKEAFTDSKMIKAWGAQLANQVYWLHHLGIADYRKDFMLAVAKTYPKLKDAKLSKQQFENKIYTLTHIIIAASGYYSHKVDYADHKHIIDYFRSNVDQILKRCKEDIIIEVGLSLLLVDDTYSEIEVMRSFINSKVDESKNMVLSVSGKSKVSQGEHRNIIAVLLLDWQGCAAVPAAKEIVSLSSLLPGSLAFK